jgi:hypothetical protein
MKKHMTVTVRMFKNPITKKVISIVNTVAGEPGIELIKCSVSEEDHAALLAKALAYDSANMTDRNDETSYPILCEIESMVRTMAHKYAQ